MKRKKAITTKGSYANYVFFPTLCLSRKRKREGTGRGGVLQLLQMKVAGNLRRDHL